MMRLWNRNAVTNGQGQQPLQSSAASTGSTSTATSKRRLRESNSIDDVKDVIKSPKPSAKTKKIDEQQSTNKKNTQLVQNHEVTNRSHPDRKGTPARFVLFF